VRYLKYLAASGAFVSGIAAFVAAYFQTGSYLIGVPAAAATGYLVVGAFNLFAKWRHLEKLSYQSVLELLMALPNQ
jgi:hypothetical protein